MVFYNYVSLKNKKDSMIGMRRLFIIVCFMTACACISAAEDIKPVSFTKVHVNDRFWRQRLDVLRKRTIRYAFQKCTDAGQIENFRLAGKILSGEVRKGDVSYQSGTTYDDAEVYKVIEGASYLLNVERDEELEKYVDGVIDVICSAQEPDGYLFTNWTIGNPLHEWMGGEKWKNDWNLSHETFDMGELIEAGVAYYQATGKDKLLNAAIRSADLICEVFNENGIKEAPGHAVIEMALVRLYEVTGDRKYLDECKFFLDCRGSRTFDPGSSDLRVNGKYWQNHLPAVEQREAVGHAVRAMYFYSGMADWARYAGDEDSVRLWTPSMRTLSARNCTSPADWERVMRTRLSARTMSCLMPLPIARHALQLPDACSDCVYSACMAMPDISISWSVLYIIMCWTAFPSRAIISSIPTVLRQAAADRSAASGSERLAVLLISRVSSPRCQDLCTLHVETLSM